MIVACLLVGAALLGSYAGVDATLRAFQFRHHATLDTKAVGFNPDLPTVIVADGFIGKAKLRWWEVYLHGGFNGYNFLPVELIGETYSIETTAQDIYYSMKGMNLERVVLLGGSMGAKVVVRVWQLIKVDPSYNPHVELLLVDPLYDGGGVKLVLAKIIRTITTLTRWRPGPMTNWLLARGNLLGKMLVPGVKKPNPHQAYGISEVPASLAWDQAYEAAGPSPEGDFSNPPPTVIMTCNPEDDEVLKQPSQTKAWFDRLKAIKVIIAPKGESHHMGADTHVVEMTTRLKQTLAFLATKRA